MTPTADGGCPRCGSVPTSGIQSSGMHPRSGPVRARVRPHRPPRRRVCHDREPARACGLDAGRGAPTGGVRLPRALTRCRAGLRERVR